MAGSCVSGVLRSSQGSRIAKHDAALEAAVWVRKSIPPFTTVLATPGIASSVSTTCLVTSSVRCSDAPSGSWTETMK